MCWPVPSWMMLTANAGEPLRFGHDISFSRLAPRGVSGGVPTGNQSSFSRDPSWTLLVRQAPPNGQQTFHIYN